MNFMFFLSALVFFSCSNEDSSSIDSSVPFYQNLKVAYNPDQQKTDVFANFNKKNALGDNITLSGSSSIKMNGEEPNYSSLGLYFYTETFSGLKDVTFKFTRQKNEVYTNKASVADVSPIEIPGSLASISIENGTVIQWIGDPVGQNETIQVQLATNSGESNFYNEEVGSHSIKIQFTEPISPGKVKLSLSRTKKMDLKETNGNAGGQMNVTYIRDKEIVLE